MYCMYIYITHVYVYIYILCNVICIYVLYVSITTPTYGNLPNSRVGPFTGGPALPALLALVRDPSESW